MARASIGNRAPSAHHASAGRTVCAVLVTGTYPAGLRDFMVRTGRFFIRLTAYGYLLTDEYPTLALD
jgi:hypothetical protein